MAYIPIEEAPNMNLNMDAMTDKTLVVYSEMNARYKQLLENDKSTAYPAFDDSGSATGIASFNDFLGTVKSKMRIFDFYKNFKAGMQFVMHLGRAANNCSTTAEGLYLDARQGKVLMDLYTKLNSDLNTFFPYNNRLHIQINGNIGSTEILKNSSKTIDYGTMMINYMQDGSRTELTINDTGVYANKIDNTGNVISSKIIIIF